MEPMSPSVCGGPSRSLPTWSQSRTPSQGALPQASSAAGGRELDMELEDSCSGLDLHKVELFVLLPTVGLGETGPGRLDAPATVTGCGKGAWSALQCATVTASVCQQVGERPGPGPGSCAGRVQPGGGAGVPEKGPGGHHRLKGCAAKIS